MTAPRRVFVFSGHMIDRLGRQPPRFPPECESAVAVGIDAALTELGAGAADLGMTQGACGGDLLFAEAMLDRGARLQLHLPMTEQAFLQESVDFRKDASVMPDRWHDRFVAVRDHSAVRVLIQPAALAGPDNVFERCNLWMLERALAFGADLRFICVWNGQGGDGPGGTEHMREAVTKRGGMQRWIDTRSVCS